jgi:CRISPR/Cas system-associated protein Cas10 (large subunit of type III CRISPR-Cas system)
VTRKYKSRPGTWIERELFESKAFLSLRGFAPQLLILILGKRIIQKHGRKGKEKNVCVNADSISFTYIEAQKKYGIDKKKVTRAIDQLLEKGFIKMVHQGGAYKKDKSIYGLSDNWTLWRPGAVFETRNKSNVKRGYCEPKKHFQQS